MSRHRIREISGVISTDDIIPGRYKHMHVDPNQLGAHVFEDRFPGLADSLTAGDILWSSELFGIGSSREQAVSALLAAGVEAVVAPQFGRIFYRNAWNLGLRLITLPRPGAASLEGVTLELDPAKGLLTGPFGKLMFAKPPERLEAIISAGGLLEWVKLQGRKEREPRHVHG
jgi:3-isopropylmalate/(R)-2-methylmalate dehydratase small subunit